MFKPLLIYIFITHPELFALFFVAPILGRGLGSSTVYLLSLRNIQTEEDRSIIRPFIKQGIVYTSIGGLTLLAISICGIVNQITVTSFLVIAVCSSIVIALIFPLFFLFAPSLVRRVSIEPRQDKEEAN